MNWTNVHACLAGMQIIIRAEFDGRLFELMRMKMLSVMKFIILKFFLSRIFGCPDGCPCPSFECAEPEIEQDPVPVEDMHLLLMPYENQERLHTVCNILHEQFLRLLLCIS